MKQEEKRIIIEKDLCGRLPHGVKIEVKYSKKIGSSLRAKLCNEGINTLNTNILWLSQQHEVYIKPYLFPLSSMTEEQKKELLDIFEDESDDGVEYKVVDFYNKYHFDYRGLIPMGLAIDATNLNIY